MFIGHYAIALSAKRASPRTSLGTLFFAAQFLDLLWPILLIAGVEHVQISPGYTVFNPLDFYDYPYSHSLFWVLIWSVVVGAGYYTLKRNAKSAPIVGSLVASHWFIDLIVHRPDLPILPGGPKFGLGLWGSIPMTLALEFAMLIGGVWIYLGEIRRLGHRPSKGFWSIIAFLVVVYLSSSFSPPPPNVETISYSALLLWLLPPWAAWAERRNPSRSSGTRT